MPGYKLGKTSRARRDTCDIKLQILCNDVINYTDYSVVTGHRDKLSQNQLYPKFSKVNWPNSKHNSMPSQAIDVAPYIKPYGILLGHKAQLIKISCVRNTSTEQANIFVLKAYARLIGIFEGVAYTHNIKLRVGMDWDGDFDLLDQSFHDLMHIELVK
jgi:peptidoglycan L-alanyl-D-glutamate endopeptidase CwlK